MQFFYALLQEIGDDDDDDDDTEIRINPYSRPGSFPRLSRIFLVQKAIGPENIVEILWSYPVDTRTDSKVALCGLLLIVEMHHLAAACYCITRWLRLRHNCNATETRLQFDRHQCPVYENMGLLFDTNFGARPVFFLSVTFCYLATSFYGCLSTILLNFQHVLWHSE